MTQAADIVQALETPAALVDAAGAVLAANAAFTASAPPAELVAGLAEGELRETLVAEGGLIGWRAKTLPGGTRLILGQPGGGGGRDIYLASLSHEFRTPLNGVLGMTALLANTPLTPAQKTYLTALRDCGEHLLGLVNDVLDLARLDAGKVRLHLAPLDLRTLLQAVSELLSPKAYAKGLEIAWSAPADLPQVVADESRLRQILFNLAGNAVKFTETGGVLLSAACAPDAEGHVRLRFVVADTGPGVPPAQRERIFEAFAQADPSHAQRNDSTGLGLAIVRRLTAAHAGQVGLECPETGGARFWFEAVFPLAEAVAPQRPLAQRTVVVISPNPIVREAAVEQVVAAGGAGLAFAAIPRRGAAPAGAVALVDHALADPKSPVSPLPGHASVILLAPEDRDRIEAYRGAGFAGYLIKPLRAASLVERVLAVIGEADAARDAGDERAGLPTAAGARVLLVEDNPINALLARSLLEREGCNVERVASGEAALEAAAGGLYDLILMDVRMPGMGGREATVALRTRGCRTPIIALTADAFEEDRHACIAAGMDDFITKPLEQPVLHAMLRRWARADWTAPTTRAKLEA